MQFRNLAKEYPEYLNDRYAISFYSYGNKALTKEEREAFIEKWKSGTATLKDWIRAGSDAFSASTLINDPEAIGETTAARRSKLYDWWIESIVQQYHMRRIKDVLRYTPSYVQEYAKLSLEELDQFLSGNLGRYEEQRFRQELGLKAEVNYGKLISDFNSGVLKSSEDIHDPQLAHHAEAILRYKSYLELIAAQGIETPQQNGHSTDSLTPQSLWPEIFELGKNITVKYRSQDHYYKEDAFVDYQIISVSGSYSPSSLRNKIVSLFQPGFEKLIAEIRTESIEDQADIISEIKDELEELKDYVQKAEYVKEESEYGPRKEYHFLKFDHLKFEGDSPSTFAFHDSSRLFISRKLAPYADEWLEGINEISRKLEHAANSLHLLKQSSTPVTYDVEAILSNVFVVESPSGGLQGTAFHLKGVGLVTCDHCIVDPTTGNILTDLVIYRGGDLNQKIQVKVLKHNEHMDLAILEIPEESLSFLKDGLTVGNSDALKHLDDIAVAGYPNYNFGDTGYFNLGRVSGFRVINGMSHVLVSNILVGGNSGGPALNASGEVIGIVATGADNFRQSHTTEWHGIIPSNILQFLK
ncbi:S1 family peptidase [Chitinophaga pinensis]|uniref:Trypsin-like peptidase n=1 Tax=Chitinophaga pinensis (strain ATCC 43595 / DSM 2588 / LMG 13176 / NBRC 15968 / NCIMB 11800 / UQM 2034) TaxID=485918 RepID=A0A979G4V1_CHIPD|nr:serine protease [Chitinophaga pinensis]ACU60692.1 hypothetical protein Cpin_3225 [Chitinophaga pinensis DSM 2588]